jgi:hypothetical protein
MRRGHMRYVLDELPLRAQWAMHRMLLRLLERRTVRRRAAMWRGGLRLDVRPAAQVQRGPPLDAKVGAFPVETSKSVRFVRLPRLLGRRRSGRRATTA